ncbi:hypothetical protein Droror1_Dr00002860 [Drosera rotundifolia]
MPNTLFLKPFLSVPSVNFSKQYAYGNTCQDNLKIPSRLKVLCSGMLKPRKFMQRRREKEVFKDAADEEAQNFWKTLMLEIEESGSPVPVLQSRREKNTALPKEIVLGTLGRLKQLKNWNAIGELLEWLRTQHWWDFNQMDYTMLMTAHGKQGDIIKAERLTDYMNKKGFPPNVVSHTALMEAYGRGRQYDKAEEVFHRMKTLGPQPSAVTYQIILNIFVEGNKFHEAEEIFDDLVNNEKSPLKPDQKMFHMMIYMHKKAGSYQKARKLFKLMADRGVQRTTVTYNSLMSFETDYREVSRIYDQMQRAGNRPDVVSYALLIHAYGKARREDEALAVFEEMLDADVRPTHKAYNILLDAFAISGMVEQAKIVFKSMKSVRFFPDLCSYTTMLSAYINASDMNGAEKFFKRIRQDGFEPNAVTYGTLIKGYANANDLDKMMKAFKEMETSGIKANQTIMTKIMDAYGKNGDFESAVFWFKEMEARGCPPDQKAKNILLSLASTDEERELATQVVEHRHNLADVDDAWFDFAGYVGEDDDDHGDDDDAGEDDDVSTFEGNVDDLFAVSSW